MYLIYIDESGTPSKRDKSRFYILSAFIINEDQWQIVDTEVNSFKTKWFPKLSPENVELHGVDIAYGKKVFRSLGPAGTLQLLDEVYRLVAGFDCTLAAVIVDKNRCWSGVSPFVWAHRLLFERLCKFLKKKNTVRVAQNLTPHYGLMMIDSISIRFDNKTRALLRGFLKAGTHYLSNEFLIEDPLFVNSQYRNMAQLTDLVVYCLGRSEFIRTNPTRTQTSRDKIMMSGFNTILPKFDTNQAGRVWGCGIKRFPPT